MKVELYDTTLRDGTQMEGISLSVQDKLKIAQKLDELGVHYVEGGWPGSNPKDAEFFAAARSLKLQNAKIVAFGSTRRAGIAADKDPNLRAVLDAATPVAYLVGKANETHVRHILETTLEENLAMIARLHRLPQVARPHRLLRRRALLRRLPRQPRLRPCLPARRRGRRRRLPRPLRHQRRRPPGRDRRRRQGRPRPERRPSASTPTTTPTSPSPTPSPPSKPALPTSRAPSTATANAAATSTSSASSPTSSSRWASTASATTNWRA